MAPKIKGDWSSDVCSSDLMEFETWSVVEYAAFPLQNVRGRQRCVEYIPHTYEILEERLLGECDWLEHLRAKTWFTEKEELDFLRAVYFCLRQRERKTEDWRVCDYKTPLVRASEIRPHKSAESSKICPVWFT
jgi:hypothetical protein